MIYLLTGQRAKLNCVSSELFYLPPASLRGLSFHRFDFALYTPLNVRIHTIKFADDSVTVLLHDGDETNHSLCDELFLGTGVNALP